MKVKPVRPDVSGPDLGDDRGVRPNVPDHHFCEGGERGECKMPGCGLLRGDHP